MKRKLLTLLLLLLSTTYTFCCEPVFRTYIVKGDEVYFGNYRSDNAVRVYADISTFKKLESADYAIDTNKVYYAGEVLSGANPSTFQFLGGTHTLSGTTGYSKDNKSVFYENKYLETADANTFKAISPYHTKASVYQDGYAKDKKQVFRYGRIMNQYDSPTFEVLGWFYTMDKSGIYYKDKLIPHSKVKENSYDTIENGNKSSYIVTSGYITIGDKVYLNGVEKAVYDASTFNVLLFDIQPETSCGGYGLECFVTKDKNGIYLNDKKLYNIDLTSFRTIDRLHFKDKNNTYTITLPTYTQKASIVRESLQSK